MTRNEAVTALIEYAVKNELIRPEEKIWAANLLIGELKADSFSWKNTEKEYSLPDILDALTADAYKNGIIEENSVVYRDLFDTKLMGLLTPRPSEIRNKFAELYADSPKKATDWYYKFSQDTNYIRRDRIAKDMRWDIHRCV